MCDGYENWRLRNNQHDVKHNKEKFNDLSCEKCYPIQFGHSNNKHFRRFTRWLRREIPETKSVSGKTAEKFLELLEIGGDFNRDNWNQKTKWRIEKNVNELLETIRYSKRPTITIKEIKEKLLYALETTQRFGTIQGKGLSESYISGSEEEIFSEDEIIKTSIEEKHWYDIQCERILRHLKTVHEREEITNKENQDTSCEKCFLVEEGIGNDKDFMAFWRWYQSYLPAISFSGVTVDIFRKLRMEERPTRIIEKVMDIVISIRYYRKPRQTNAKICRKLGRLFSIWIYEDITFSQAINRESETLREAELSEISEISERNTKENSPEKNDSSPESEKSEKERETFIEELEEELRNETELGKGKSKEKSVEEIIGEIEDEIGREMNDAEINELQIVLMETSKQIEVIIGEFVKILQKNDEQEIQQTEERESDEIENSEEESEQEFENAENEGENIFEEQDENIINTPQILSDNSTSENSDSSEEIEIEEMALNIIKCRQFDRVANANNWVEADQDNNQRTLMAKAHLTGEAAAWLQTGNNDTTYNRWKSNGNAANQLAEGLKTRFNTPERQQRWQREFYQIKQQPGESVESYATRFNAAARRVGNNIAEIGKATTFVQGLLPAIYSMTVIGGQNNTMDAAIESVKRAELTAIGQLQQIMIPQNMNQLGSQNVGESVYQKLQKEKADNTSMDELMKKFNEMEIRLLRKDNDYRNNRRYNNRNNQNFECFACGRKGHKVTECKDERKKDEYFRRGRRLRDDNENRNYRNNRRNDDRDERNRNGNRTRDLNLLGVTFEEKNAPEREYSSDEEYSEDEKQVFDLRSGKRRRRNETIESDEENEIKEKPREKL